EAGHSAARLALDADDPPGLVGPRQDLVRRRHRLEPAQGFRAPRRGAARLIIDMEHHQLVGGCQPAFAAVVHRMEEVQALLVMVEDLRGDAQRVAGMDLAVIGDMRLEHEHHAEPMLDIAPADAELIAQGIGGMVEGDHVIADIHVAVGVDPVGADRGAMAVERRREIQLRQRGGEAHRTFRYEKSGSQPVQASQNTAKAIDSSVIGMPARAYSAKPIWTPKALACSTTRMLVRLPMSSRLPASDEISASA